MNHSLQKFYYMYGKHSVLAALQNPKREIKKVLCTKKIFQLNQKLINNFPFQITNTTNINKIINTKNNHQGIAAYLKSKIIYNIKNINLNHKNNKIVILDQIYDPQNIGSIIRSAISFNINTIILPVNNTPDENAIISKAASGSIELAQIIKVININNTLKYLKKIGFWIIGLDVNTKQNLEQNVLKGKIVIIIGSENKGIRESIKKSCDLLLKIPLYNNINSLNASNAASIAFYLSSLN